MGTDTQEQEVELVELVVRAVWRDLLGIENAPADADFFALGGDSLLLVRFAGRLRSELARQVAPHELLARPTPAGMTAVVLAAEALELESEVEVELGGGESGFEVSAAMADAGAGEVPAVAGAGAALVEAGVRQAAASAAESQRVAAGTGANAGRASILIESDPHPAGPVAWPAIGTVADTAARPTGAWMFAVRLSGAVEQDTLAEALTWVARRNQSLRTSFGADGQARVAPARTIECPFEVIAAGPDAAAARLAGPIDRGAAPLMRAVLAGSVLTVAIDRAVFGAAAVPAFLDDLQAVCRLVAEGAYSELAREQPDFVLDSEPRCAELEWVRAV